MAFHLDPRKAEARVQLIGFQRASEEGNREIERDRGGEKEYLCARWRKKENGGNSER